MSLLAMPSVELTAYLHANYTPSLFYRDEVFTLWRSSSHTIAGSAAADGTTDKEVIPEQSFDMLWEELNSVSVLQPHTAATSQQMLNKFQQSGANPPPLALRRSSIARTQIT